MPMTKEYSQEQLWEFYEKLPEELKESVFSEKTAESVFNICTRNNIRNEQISEVAALVGRVLLGILPPNELQKALEKEIGLKDSMAKKVNQEISHLVFSPISNSLSRLYGIETAPQTKTVNPAEKKNKPKIYKKDAYREAVE